MAHFTLMHALYKFKKIEDLAPLKSYNILLYYYYYNTLMYILLKRLKSSLHRHFSLLHKGKLRQDLKEKKENKIIIKKAFCVPRRPEQLKLATSVC